MEDEPVYFIRESTRNLLKLNRQSHRDEQNDVGRNLENVRVTADTILAIANKLKTKSTVSPSELHMLKNAIIDDQNNINIVLGVYGSLRGLVREVSGSDVKRQIEAAGCCCNLALGDVRASSAVCRAAGPYLTAALHGLNTEMSVTCAWALGNLAGSDPKNCETLAAQGALGTLVELLTLSGCEDVVDSAVYALMHFAYQMRENLSQEHLFKILQAYPKLKTSMTSSQLLFILSCHSAFTKDDILLEPLLSSVLQSTTVSIQTHLNKCTGLNLCCELVYLIRTLANLSVTNLGIAMLIFFETKIGVSTFKMLLDSKNSYVKESCSWLLGNLFKSYSDSNFFKLLLL